VKTRHAFEAVGTALLILLPYCSKFLLPSNLEIYHLHLPVTHLMAGILLDLLLYSILAALLLTLIDDLPPLPQTSLEAGFAGLLLWLGLDFALVLLCHFERSMDAWSRAWQHVALAIPALLAAVAIVAPRIARRLSRMARLTAAGISFSILWIVPQLIHLALARPVLFEDASLQHPPVLRVEIPADAPHRRVIWILFDELSYAQAFEHPAPGIELPNFSRFAKVSISFSNLKPVGFYTDRIIPSLFLGRPIERIRSTVDGHLWYWDPSQARWLVFDPNQTVFAFARRNGWSTAIDGWYNPYCRLLGQVLDACSWQANQTALEQLGASESKSDFANAAILPNRFLANFRNSATAEEGQIENYRNIMTEAEVMIADPQLQFIFIHIPVPHGPAIFDRRSDTFRTGGTYLDSLVLADDSLGSLMQFIKRSSDAARTTVLVSSDHSWRISLSRGGKDWSEEEERASEGKFDDRPVLLVHFPNEQSGETIPDRLPELLEHPLVEGLLTGAIDDVEDVHALPAQLPTEHVPQQAPPALLVSANP
jgi:hypothetical protein